jgi:hypothetical protein
MTFAINSRLSSILETEIEDQKLHLSPYCEEQVERMISIGVQRMSIANVTGQSDKIFLAERNIKRLVEYLSNQAKSHGTYPEMEESTFDTAIAECFPLWPYC